MHPKIDNMNIIKIGVGLVRVQIKGIRISEGPLYLATYLSVVSLRHTEWGTLFMQWGTAGTDQTCPD